MSTWDPAKAVVDPSGQSQPAPPPEKDKPAKDNRQKIHRRIEGEEVYRFDGGGEGDVS